MRWTGYPGAVSYTITRKGYSGAPPITYHTGTALEFAYEVEPGLTAAIFQVAAMMDEGTNAEAVAYADLPVDVDINHSINAEFSTEANPPANGRWTLGYSTVAGEDFTPVTFFYPDSQTDDGTTVPAWQLDLWRSPAFWHNNSGRTLTTGGGAATMEPGTLLFVGGDDGFPENYGVIRYTVPAGEAGSYQVAASVQGFYTIPGMGGDTDFHILHNGWELYGNFLAGDASAAIVRRVDLAAGDTIDFVVGRGADGSQYASVLKIWATLQKITDPDPAAGTWTAASSLPAARSEHTATALPNGKVLVTGGTGTGGALASTLLYNPDSDSWTTVGALATARYYHTATLLPNGKVLVAGGYGTSGLLASAELYDPATGVWTTTGSLATPRRLFTATLLPDGKVLTAGGYGGTSGQLTSAELYDPATGTWSATGSLTVKRGTHTANLLPNGKVLLAGGFGTGGYLASANLYDPATGTWSATGSMGTARRLGRTAVLPDGRVLMAGGNGASGVLASVELYNPASGTWTPGAPMNSARRDQTATVLATSGKVLVAGGLTAGNVTVSTTELYDPGTGAWTPAAPLAVARFLHTATVLPNNGKLLVIGGKNSGGAQASAALYTP